MPRRLLRLIVPALLLGLAGCSSAQAPRPGGPPLVLGAIYPLSGPQSEGGHEEFGGVRAALQVARDEGLPGADRVRLQVEDVQTPAEAVAAVDRLIDRYHVPLIVGTYGSTLSAAAAARADQRHVVYWETGAVADQVTAGRQYVFRTVATGSSLGRMAVGFTQQVLLGADGLTPATARVAIVGVDDVYGQSVADAEEAGAREAGIQVVDRVRYSPYAYDASAIAEEVAAAHPDFLWDVSYLSDGIDIWRAMLDHRVPLRAAIGTSSAFCMDAFGKTLGRQAVGLYAADKPSGAIPTNALAPAAKALLSKAIAAYRPIAGESDMPIPGVAGFVGGWVLLHDVLPAVLPGQVTSDRLRDAAYTVDVPQGMEINGGGARFSPPGNPDAGQNLRTAAVVGQWQAVDQMKVVFPAQFAETAPKLQLSAPKLG
jgi:branched-chain amino acid transport system substrate-binding protein